MGCSSSSCACPPGSVSSPKPRAGANGASSKSSQVTADTKVDRRHVSQSGQGNGLVREQAADVDKNARPVHDHPPKLRAVPSDSLELISYVHQATLALLLFLLSRRFSTYRRPLFSNQPTPPVSPTLPVFLSTCLYVSMSLCLCLLTHSLTLRTHVHSTHTHCSFSSQVRL